MNTSCSSNGNKPQRSLQTLFANHTLRQVVTYTQTLVRDLRKIVERR